MEKNLREGGGRGREEEETFNQTVPTFDLVSRPKQPL
jgi:hypothetical protein